MPKRKIEYTEISRAKVTDTRHIVISNCSKGGFTIAQNGEIREGKKVTEVFFKGAFHVDNLQGLYNLRDAVNLAIKKTEEAAKEASEWDEEE